LGLLLSIQTPIGQFLKLPALIEHYLKHQEQEQISLFEFLDEHYTAGHDDEDLPEDQRLPFKNIEFFAMGYAVVPAVIYTDAAIEVPAEKKYIFPRTYSPQQHLNNIFHPPRV
jgi:hypothetical protein